MARHAPTPIAGVFLPISLFQFISNPRPLAVRFPPVEEDTPMKRATFLAVLVVAVGSVLDAVPQETAKKPEPLKAAPSPSVAMLAQWNEIGRKLTAMAEDFPEDKYDFKGAASADGFAQRLIHAAAANYYFTIAAVGKKLSAEED